MPVWFGIEDSSASAGRVWLGRRRQERSTSQTSDHSSTSSNTSSSQTISTSSEEPWTPLRKIDCAALNSSPPNQTCFVEGGRATADPVNNVIFLNFFRGPQRELTSAIWFIQEIKSKEMELTPITNTQDSEKIESLYKAAVDATSSLGQGINSVLMKEVTLSDNSKVKIVKANGTLSMQKTPPGWFTSPQILQRGYGEYTVDGEEEEAMLGPVRHVVFVVHGIGEAMFSRENITLPGMIEQTNITRKVFQQRQIKAWKEECEKMERAGKPRPPPPNRVEFLPIEWFEEIHNSSSELMRTLGSVSLPSIPALRDIANTIVIDVLLYMTPAFCQAVIENVTGQINDLFQSFQKIHPNFASSGGECSLIGHSLGSVICWDILSILKESQERDPAFPGVSFDENEVGYHAYARQEHANVPRYGTWGPSLAAPVKKTIAFKPKATIFLGSPVGLFLTMRGCRPVFDAMRKPEQGHCEMNMEDIPPTSPFELPTSSLYNIFNGNDPVAYRIEPLLLPLDTPESEIPPPEYLTAPGKDLRLHIKAKQFGDEIRRSIKDPRGSYKFLVESAVSSLSTFTQEDGNLLAAAPPPPGPVSFPLANPQLHRDGKKGVRVDYSFQPAMLDSEYLSAVLAHSTSSYFCNEDFQDFMIDKFKEE